MFPQSFGTGTLNYLHNVCFFMSIFSQMALVVTPISSQLINMVAVFGLDLILRDWFTHFRFHVMRTEMSNPTLFGWQPLSIIILQ